VPSYDLGGVEATERPGGGLLLVSDAPPRPYERREPENTPLYRIVSEHLETFLEEVREHHDKALPKYVEKELREFLDCGILVRGYVLAVCCECGRKLFVALSCKKRVCPLCFVVAQGVEFSDKSAS
jgi:hypothetical protein